MTDELLTTQSRLLNGVGAFLRSGYWVSEYVFVLLASHVIYAYWFEPDMLKVRIGLFIVVTAIPLVLVESLLTACWKRLNSHFNKFIWCMIHLSMLAGVSSSISAAFIPRGAFSYSLLAIEFHSVIALSIASVAASPSFLLKPNIDQNRRSVETLWQWAVVLCLWMPQFWFMLVLDAIDIRINHGLATFIAILQLAFVMIAIFIQRYRNAPHPNCTSSQSLAS